MKLFRIFAVGLILSAVVVATAVAPISSAASSTPPPNGSFTSPNIDVSSFSSAVLNYTSPTTSTTGPTSDPPEADVVPNFSGLVVNGPTAIDGDDDGTEDIIIDEDGEIFINNKFEVDVNADGNEELEITPGLIALGDFPGGMYIAITSVFNMIQFETNDGFFSVKSPFVDFVSGSGADVKFQIDGDLTVEGLIKSYEAIGSYYVNKDYASGYSSTVSCDTGDLLTGCSGWSYGTGVFKGTYPDGISCISKRSTSGGIWAYANCLDPTGAKSGTYNL